MKQGREVSVLQPEIKHLKHAELLRSAESLGPVTSQRSREIQHAFICQSLSAIEKSVYGTKEYHCRQG